MLSFRNIISEIRFHPVQSILCLYYKVILQLVEAYYTFYCHFKMRLHGIKFGRGRFCGNTLFYIEPGAKVSIGDGHAFNSINKANFRGVNHRCIIEVDKNAQLSIGNNCGFTGVSIVCAKKIVIGDNLLCGTNVMIGDRNDHEDKYPQFTPQPIIIGDNVWIGMNTVVMKGVNIGNNVIIGANSIVTRDIPDNMIAVGNPCKTIKENTSL